MDRIDSALGFTLRTTSIVSYTVQGTVYTVTHSVLIQASLLNATLKNKDMKSKYSEPCCDSA